MIIAGVIFYNDSPALIEKCLLSIKGKVDKIVCVDGAYKEFPHDKPFSTDGCLEVAGKYADTVIDTLKAWDNQAQKRNQYFIGGEGDYYFIIDTDEYLEGRLPENPDKDVYRIQLDTKQNGNWLPGLYCRLIKHQPGIRYDKKHNMIKVDGILINNPGRHQPLIKEGKILHTPEDRGVKRLEQDGHYLRTRQEEKIDYVDNSFLSQKEYKNMPIVLKRKENAFLKKYTGTDSVTGKTVIAERNEIIRISIQGAIELFTDYPNEWQFVKSMRGGMPFEIRKLILERKIKVS